MQNSLRYYNMLIERIEHDTKLIIEIWDDEYRPDWNFKEPFGEKFYVDVNDWCVETIGYPARTAYNRFEFKQEKDLTLFILKWK